MAIKNLNNHLVSYDRNSNTHIRIKSSIYIARIISTDNTKVKPFFTRALKYEEAPLDGIVPPGRAPPSRLPPQFFFFFWSIFWIVRTIELLQRKSRLK